jgi:hypothetical protein
MMSPGPPPVDRGRVFILWVLQGIAVAIFAALSLAIVIVPISENSWRVDPATVPAGVPYEVTITSMGPWTTIRCPALIGWHDSEQPAWCSDLNLDLPADSEPDVVRGGVEPVSA